MDEVRSLFISCEHGGNWIPPDYQSLFFGEQERLNSHLGYDPGALVLAKNLAKGMSAPLVKSETSRLLVDLNRSLRSKTLLSEFVRGLDKREKSHLLDQHYRPYRAAVTKKVSNLIAAGAQVIHLSVHSFAPSLRGQTRNAELGLLYDPTRYAEKQFSVNWQYLLRQRIPELGIRRNYPYRGTADGLVRTLRYRFKAEEYLGIELEVNQALLDEKYKFPTYLVCGLLETLQEIFATD